MNSHSRTIRALGIGAVLVFALGGCASAGPTFAQVHDQVPPLAASKGRVFMYRSSSVASYAKPDIRINDAIVGQAKAGSIFYIDLKPGHYKIETTSDEAANDADFTLKSGEVLYVRFEESLGTLVGQVHPELVSISVGIDEAKNCTFDPDKRHLLRLPASYYK
jgi:hypothetical protein